MEFLVLTFSRHDTCNLLCDTSLALARVSPTRRYTGLSIFIYEYLILPLYFRNFKELIDLEYGHSLCFGGLAATQFRHLFGFIFGPKLGVMSDLLR